ncbi:MAG: AmmeMemoRadiSam system protein A [Candidatus Cloacimonadota bacterium]|nr:AmmeMemoRadiSam system protein A [Candidatus Cloacimonadota bacterium]
MQELWVRDMLNNNQKKFLLRLAKRVIESEINNTEIGFKKPDDEIYNEKFGGFVTIHDHGKLRGCIGYVEAYKSIYETIIDMAKSAAFNDPRFTPIRKKDLDFIDIEISILSPLEEFSDINSIKIGQDGLLIKNTFQSGLLLPQVATEWGWNKIQFIEQTCKKAGLDINCWKDKSCIIYKFKAEVFDEKIFDT